MTEVGDDYSTSAHIVELLRELEKTWETIIYAFTLDVLLDLTFSTIAALLLVQHRLLIIRRSSVPNTLLQSKSFLSRHLGYILASTMPWDLLS